MKTIDHSTDRNFNLLSVEDIVKKTTEVFDKEKKQKKIVELQDNKSCIIKAIFFGQKPEIGDLITAIRFNIENLKVAKIIENRDAKKQHYPKIINGIEYTEDDLKRPEAKGINFNHEKAYFVFRLET